MVVLGRVKIRLKDFYDIHDLDDERLSRAIAATFARRKTQIPAEPPDALKPAFANDETQATPMAALIEDVAVNPGSRAEVVGELTALLMAAGARTLHFLDLFADKRSQARRRPWYYLKRGMDSISW